MRNRTTIAALAALTFIGCGAPSLPPPSPSHPASPAGPEAPIVDGGALLREYPAIDPARRAAQPPSGEHQEHHRAQ